VNLQLDRTNCGACGRTCATGQVCAAGVCNTIAGAAFQVTSLGATGCAAIDHNALTGDDKGGIAVSATNVFYTGDTATARFSATDLSGGASIGRVVDGFVSNLRTGTVYVLGNGATELPQGGGTLTSLLEVNGATGALTGARINLSSAITVSAELYFGAVGIFSGYDRIIIYNGTRAYHIALPSGVVVDLGAVALASHTNCENWAIWGTAEFFGGSLYVDYVQNATTIVRTRIPDGATSTLGTFTNLSDMCSFTISPARNRWYFHHEYTSQFIASSNETVGYCAATWLTDSATISTHTFPSTGSQVGNTGSVTGTLGAGGGGGFRFTTGDFVQEGFTRTAAYTRLDLNFQMSDVTAGCAVGQALSWNVLVNGVVVGTYGFAGGTGVNPRTITGTYTFASQPAGTATVRLQATTSVCPGGSSWNWIAGGSATLR
jgi:hypothetical protein